MDFLSSGWFSGFESCDKRYSNAVSRESNVPYRFTFGYRLSDKRFFMAVNGASSPAASSASSATASAPGSAIKASISSDPITDGVAIRDSAPSSLFPVFSAVLASRT